MKSTLAAVKRQRFPSQASRRVRGLFILGLGSQQKNRKEGEDLSRPVQFFLSSLPGVYGWVTSTIFGGGQSVK